MLAAAFAAASSAVAALSGTRRNALGESLEGAAKRSLERYIRAEASIEARWLVLRVTGLALSAMLVLRYLPSSLGDYRLFIAAFATVIAYGLPAQIGRALVARAPERAIPFLLRFLQPIELMAAPIAAPLAFAARLVTKSMRRTEAPAAGVTETEVELIVNEGELNGSLAHDQGEMIRNVLEFGDIVAGEIMVPRTRVTAIDIQTSPEDLLKLVTESQHSRYPIYQQHIDNVVGILHVKELLRLAAENQLNKLKLQEVIRRPVAFVPETQLASTVLRDMRAGRHHMAIVIDEFGGFSGIITLEDLVEEIVGDIRDETDEEEPPIVDMGDGRLMVDASVPIDDLSRYLGAELPEDGDYNSLGGFLVDRLGRVPPTGAKLNAFGMEFVVREADERHVVRVEIVRQPQGPGPESVSPRSSKMSAA